MQSRHALYLATSLAFGCLNPYAQAAKQQETMNQYVAQQNAQGQAQQTAIYEKNIGQSRDSYKASPSAGTAIGFAVTIEFSYVSSITQSVPLQKEALLTEGRTYLSEAAKTNPDSAQMLAAEEAFLLIVFGDKLEAERLLTAATSPKVNPYAVPYLAFLYDEQDKLAENAELCKKGLSSTKDNDLRYRIIESCYTFTRAKSLDDTKTWATKADWDFYQKQRQEIDAAIAKEAQERSAEERARCDEQMKTYSSFSNTSAYDSAARCDAAKNAKSARYVSYVETIRTLAPRSVVIRSSCAKPVSLWLGSQMPTGNAGNTTIQANGELRREVRAQEYVIIVGGQPGPLSNLPLSAGIRAVEIQADCSSLRAF